MDDMQAKAIAATEKLRKGLKDHDINEDFDSEYGLYISLRKDRHFNVSFKRYILVPDEEPIKLIAEVLSEKIHCPLYGSEDIDKDFFGMFWVPGGDSQYARQGVVIKVNNRTLFTDQEYGIRELGALAMEIKGIRTDMNETEREILVCLHNLDVNKREFLSNLMDKA